MNNRAKTLAAVLILFLNIGRLFGEEKRSSLSCGLSYVQTSGNTETETASLDALFKQKWPSLAVTLKGGILTSQQEGRTNAESYYFQEKGDVKIGKKIYLYEVWGWMRDVFSGLDSRYSVQSGMGCNIPLGTRHRVDVEAGIDYTWEDGREVPFRSFGSVRTFGRYRYTLSDTASAEQEIEYLKNMEAPEDYRIYSSTALKASISTNLSMKVSYVIRYDHQPVPGFRDTDTVFSTALILKI